MRPELVTRLYWLAAAFLWLAAIWLLLGHAGFMQDATQRYTALQQQQQELRTAAEQLARWEAMQQEIAALPADQAPELNQLMAGLISADSLDERTRDQRKLGEGWSVLQKDLMFEDVPVSYLFQAMHKLEQARPPWDIQSFSIVADAKSPGQVRGSLLVETLIKP